MEVTTSYQELKKVEYFMTKTPIKIELTEEDAVMFAQFQKRYAFFNLLESLKVFDIKNGSLTIHFDKFGGLGKIKVEQFYSVNEE